MRLNVFLLPFLLTFHFETSADVGQDIYEKGILSNGMTITGVRNGEIELKGQSAVCMSCHKQSGLGGFEGNNFVPPIASNFLFNDPSKDRSLIVNPRNLRVLYAHQPAYSDQDLAQILRSGVRPDGVTLGSLMPRYDLKDDDMNALISYLHSLSNQYSTGVTDRTLRFATIFTPDVTVEQKFLITDILNKYFKYRNTNWVQGGRKMRMGTEAIPRTERQWELSIWQLEGNVDTWSSQLADFYKEDPVFAIISGASNSEWKPVDQFCDANKIPCLFPSIPNVETSSDNKYSFYFNKGVKLDADVLSLYLNRNALFPKKIIQVLRKNPVTSAVADHFKQTVPHSLIEQIYLTDNNIDEIASLIYSNHDSSQDFLLWLTSEDLKRLLSKRISSSGNIFVSGTLAGLDTSIFPESTSSQLKIIYPYELPAKREKQLKTVRSWAFDHNVNLTDSKLQSEVLFNMNLLTEVTGQMMDNLYRTYMMESTEWLLSQPDNLTVYPVVNLGPNQRILSKGAYIVSLKQNKLTPIGERIVP